MNDFLWKKIFFEFFLDVFFEIFRDVLVSRVGGWYQTLPYEVCFQRFIVRQAIKFFKPTFERFSLKKSFFWIFFRCIFWNFSRCIGFQRRGVVSNASLWSGLSAVYSSTESTLHKEAFDTTPRLWKPVHREKFQKIHLKKIQKKFFFKENRSKVGLKIL